MTLGRWRVPWQPWQVALLALVMALAFLGSRPIWDPDEGRYSNVALMMLDSGDWLDPARHPETNHWTKPPLTYWLVAASVKTFGHATWAVRLPVALAYLACVLAVMRIARWLVPGREALAGLVYATMALPLTASQILTTDFVMTAWQTLAMAAFARARFGPSEHAARWRVAMCALFGLAFLTKGPPALLPLLAIAALGMLAPAPGRLAWGTRIACVAAFLAMALPWYVNVTLRHPGLLEYFLGTEVVERVAGDMGRNGAWYGWFIVYAPTLILGSLPWTRDLARWLRATAARLHDWRVRAARDADAGWLLLAAWIALPLLVFCLARSRLPLYLLPLFAPFALAIAALRSKDATRAWPDVHGLAIWLVCICLFRVATALWPTHKDASAWADAIRARAGDGIGEVVFVDDMARYGLHFHLGVPVEKIALLPGARTGFMPDVDGDVDEELFEHDHRDTVWIAKERTVPRIEADIARHGFRLERLGPPYRGRIFFRVRRLEVPPVASARHGDDNHLPRVS